MVKAIFDERFWTQDFAITDGDMDRLYDFLQQARCPARIMDLLAQVVQHKLERSSLELDAEQRRRSAVAAQKLLQDQDVEVYRQTGDYRIGKRLLVSWRVENGWDYGIGEVVRKEMANEPHYRWLMTLRFPDETERLYVAEADLTHPKAQGQGWQLATIQADLPIEKAVDEVLQVYGGLLVSHLLGRLDEDKRFVRWGDSCWLAKALPSLPADALERVAAHLWVKGSDVSTDNLLPLLALPADEAHRWALNVALAADDRFRNEGSEADPRWTAPLPDHVLRLEDGALVDLSAPPDVLWARHCELFHGPVPREWANNPHVLWFGSHWLLDALLMRLTDDDLGRARQYLAEQGQAVSDTDILKYVFKVSSQDDHFERWRFSLSYQLQQKAQELGIEYVGSGEAWSWALAEQIIEKPERHRRLRGTEGLSIVYAEPAHVAQELTGDGETLDPPEPEEKHPKEWRPAAQVWQYVLTYYDWDNGVLPYNQEARKIIPPLQEGQRRAMLRFRAQQVDDRPFQVSLYSGSGDPKVCYLLSQGLKDLFVGYLVPGARIWIERTEEPGLYTIRYQPTAPQPRRLLFFEKHAVTPSIKKVEIKCEVDEDMLLAESRYGNLERLNLLDLMDRRTAPKVLAQVFEGIGQYDESRGVYRARFDDLFPLLCITKPYSKAYVNRILHDRNRFPWFYPDDQLGKGCFVYDPAKAGECAPPPSPPEEEREPVQPMPKKMEALKVVGDRLKKLISGILHFCRQWLRSLWGRAW